MRVEIITTISRLAEIALEWDELYKSDPHAHIYLSSGFLSSVALRAQGTFRLLAAWSEDGRCVGILPLTTTLQWSKTQGCLYNALDMLGHVFDADYTGILCAPGHDEAVCQAFASTVSSLPFGRIILNYFSAPPSRLEAFTNAFDTTLFDTKNNTHLINDGETNNLICPYIDLPDTFSDYLAALSSNARQKIRRLLRQLESDPSLTITRAQPETYTQDVTILSELWYQKHVAQKGETRAKRLAELFKEVVMLGLASGSVYLAILRRDGAPVAAQANYIDLVRREALFHVSGRDESVRDLSTGLMLQAHCIRWAIANGLKRYDFTIGNEPYKYSLGAIDREIASAEVFTKTGVNTTGLLDTTFRDDVVKIIANLSRKGRNDDARTAATQALKTWPALEAHGDADALVSSLS